MKAFTAGDARLNSAYNFDFLYAPGLGAERVQASASLWDQSDGEGWPSWAFSNHDAPRAVTRWASPEHRDDMARVYMMLLLTLRGNPIIYQGEELGLPQANVPFSHLKDPEAIMNWPKTLGRDGARTPLPWSTAEPHAGFTKGEPWLPVDPEHTSLAIDQQQGNDSVLRFTAQALSVRKRMAALTRGRMAFEPVGDDRAMIIHRDLDGARVSALFNFGNTAHQFPEALVSQGDLILSSRPLKEGLLQGGLIPERAGVWIRAV
jgi:alpha-glucosidase